MKLEKMDAFFDERLEIYDAHQLHEIQAAEEFYPFTAHQLPLQPGCKVLDLGCGTGLELEFYFQCNPAACVTGIDLAPGMLAALQQKFPGRQLTLLQGSYFTIPFATAVYDAAVSVESLHHFTQAQKVPLYRKLHNALKPGGYFILTDYFAETEQEERACRAELDRIARAQGVAADGSYHFDTPLTCAHEIEALQAAGFSAVEILAAWGQTKTIRSKK